MVAGVRALEPTSTEDRGLAWSGSRWRWRAAPTTRLDGTERGEAPHTTNATDALVQVGAAWSSGSSSGS